MVVSVREFKNRATELIRLVESGRRRVTITRHARPVAQLVPLGKPAMEGSGGRSTELVSNSRRSSLRSGKTAVDLPGYERPVEAVLPAVATASLSYVEFFSGLHRKLRERAIDEKAFQRAAEAFDADWPHWTVVSLSADVLRMTRRVIERHGLRAGDAVQLASALTLAAVLAVEFVSTDRRLNQAARRDGLRVL
jgi:prevent-host-death family protein